ncbi:elongator complex protein 6-like [Scleropages formosus]|uniref:Elongator complex protein 6 n=1 Tax=Scleropages formosus TaxID=113540 RepID=A0A0P7UYK6_SCLFO|nr:elongator complex protein 6 [Scleropages formosus]KPP65227.1 elongator complex protein 6-like [Scleropages formosus]
MFPELNSILSISPENIPQGQFVVLSDRSGDASFLIHHFLSLYLRAGCKVCFLGLVQSFSHYSAIAQRLGISLPQARERGQLVFLEGLKESLGELLLEDVGPGEGPLDFLRCPQSDLRSLFAFVRRSVSKGVEWGPPVLLVDDVSVLLSLGVTVGALQDFSHYCKAALCRELKGNMVMLVRVEEDEEEEQSSELLLKALSHQCSLALHVQGLSTGYCKDIHGQVEVCWRGGAAPTAGFQQQKKLFQYKVHDKGATFFARGTSSAIL